MRISAIGDRTEQRRVLKGKLVVPRTSEGVRFRLRGVFAKQARRLGGRRRMRLAMLQESNLVFMAGDGIVVCDVYAASPAREVLAEYRSRIGRLNANIDPGVRELWAVC